MCPKLSSHARLRSLFFCVYQDVLPGRNTREIEWFTQRNSDVVYRKENKAKPRQKNKRKKKDEIGQDGKKESIGHLHPVAEVFEKRTYTPKQEGKSRPTQSNPIFTHGEYLSRSTPRKTSEQDQEERMELEKAVKQRNLVASTLPYAAKTLAPSSLPRPFYTCS